MSEYFVVRKGATALRNEVVWDSSISYGALGILARALATAPGADLGYRAFAGRGMGEKAVRAALGELEEAGYRHRFTVRREGGRIRTVTVFSDVSMGRAEALSELPEEQRAGVVDPEEPRQSCGSRIRRSHRAADGAARSDLGKRTPSEGSVDNLSDDGRRAAPGAARSDLGKQSVSAGRTVPRSTVARSSAALSLRDTKPSSSLRSEEESFDQTGPERTGVVSPGAGAGSRPGRVRSGRVRDRRASAADRARRDASPGSGRRPGPEEAGGGVSGVEPESATEPSRPQEPREEPVGVPPKRGARRSGAKSFSRPSQASSGGASGDGRTVEGSEVEGAGLPAEVRGLLGSCLPASMLRVASDPQGALEVAGLLRERVEAGWRPGEIRSALDEDLPEPVGHLSRLVAWRLRHKVDPDLAPAALVVAGEGQVELARRAVRVVEPLRTRDQELDQELSRRAWEQVRREHPDVGQARQVSLAGELVEQWKQAEAREAS